MGSSRSFQKRIAKSYFEEISSFDLFYQISYMAATTAAGVSRARIFQLARQLPCATAHYFKSIQEVTENLRYNYPDAVRMVGEHVKAEEVKTFLFRLSDALRSGEPLNSFLPREAHVQSENYANDYGRRLESLRKWTDAYTAITVSAALIVIINMVSAMIYDVGTATMLMMIMVAVAASFGIAWIMFRAAPQETKSVPLAQGSRAQQRSRKLFLILMPVMFVVCLILAALGLGAAWVLIVAGACLLPIGLVSRKADNETSKKDDEISAFFRSLGGTATSRGTTLKEALSSMKIDSFPATEPDIRMLHLRLSSFGKPALCWQTFGQETGSRLAQQATTIFYDAINMGGDPEKTGFLTSEFAMKTAMLRAQRRGIGGTFAWLTMAMQAVLAALMVFLLEVLKEFAVRLNTAMSSLEQGTSASAQMGLGGMFSFSAPQVRFLETTTIGMVVLLAVVNAFAVVAAEGSHLIKISYYLSLLAFLSGVCFLIVPPIVRGII